MRGRPLLYTQYEDEQALLPSVTRKVMVALLFVVALTIPFEIIPGLGFLASSGWLILLNRALIFAIGALGLNILTGLAGQVSLGHAFFMGVGAYAAVYLGGEASGSQLGLGLPIWIWLPAAGVAAALVGIIVAPTSVRVRGLYLAIVTLGLVFIGEHIFRNWSSLAGPAELGRVWPPLEFRFWKEETALIDFDSDGAWFGFELLKEAKIFFLMLGLAALFTVLAKNLARTRIGRSFAAIRDRDIAAEVMGVADAKAKTQAFAISSFYAGIAGALLASVVGRLPPEQWNLFLSVQFVAIVLIGGAGTVAGVLLGSFFVVLLPRLVENVSGVLAQAAEGDGWFQPIADFFVARSTDDFGLVFLGADGPGLTTDQLNAVLYGLLIALFLIFEPLGLFGIWIKIRNYWKGWPFTY